METYHLKVAGLERDLPVCPLGNGVSIAGFVMFSDVELTIACATELLKKVPDCDVFLTAESKGIPLAYEMSRQSGKRYILARKSKKLYMKTRWRWTCAPSPQQGCRSCTSPATTWPT